MPRVDQVKLDLGQVALVRVSAVGREDFVVLAPDDERRRLMLAEICLYLRIKRQIGAIVVEQVHLDFGVTWPIGRRLIMALVWRMEDPGVGIEGAHIGDAVGVLELGRLRRDQDVKRLAVLLRVVGPIGFERVPELLEAFLVGVAVLYDEGGDALGMLESEAPADG